MNRSSPPPFHISPSADRTSAISAATGRGSKALKWLGALGHLLPVEERVAVGLRYVTRLYRRPPGDAGRWGLVHAHSRPPQRRMGIALAVEGDRWIVTMGGMLGEQAPSDAAGFAEYAATLARPQIAELIRRCEPVGDAARTGFPAHVRRRCDRLSRPAEGFLMLGDALACHSPIYGQGIAVAAQEAWRLGACIDAHGLAGLPRRYYRAVAPVIDVAWLFAAGSDLRFPEVEGARPLRQRVLQAHLGRVRSVGRRDEPVAVAYRRVLHLVEPVGTLVAPGVVGRVAAGRLRERLGTIRGVPAGSPQPVQTEGG